MTYLFQTTLIIKNKAAAGQFKIRNMQEILVLSSIAILATLLYASFLDIKTRRVPFRTWYPASVVAVPVMIIFYYFTYGMEAGIGPFVFVFLPFFISGVLLLLDWAWTIYIRKADRSEIDTSVIAGTYISWIYPAVPASVVITACIIGYWNYFSVIALISLVFCVFLEIISCLHLWGGADTSAMIVISSAVPVSPILPLWGYTVAAFFPISVLLNAVILNLAVPAGLLVYNILKGNKAPLRYMFIGYPVPGDEIAEHFGFVMEDIREEGDLVEREFMKFRSLIGRTVSGKKRMYTQDFKRNPEEYAAELELYRKAGRIWIGFGVPFIVPIMAGFIIAFFFGDIFFFLARLAGAMF